MTTVVLDTHVLHWLTAEPRRLSRRAQRTIAGADDLAISDITWWELALLEERARIVVRKPVSAWLADLVSVVRTLPITPAIAQAAARLPAAFPGDPADRLIFATAFELGWPLVTKDEKMRTHPQPRPVTVW